MKRLTLKELNKIFKWLKNQQKNDTIFPTMKTNVINNRTYFNIEEKLYNIAIEINSEWEYTTSIFITIVKNNKPIGDYFYELEVADSTEEELIDDYLDYLRDLAKYYLRNKHADYTYVPTYELFEFE